MLYKFTFDGEDPFSTRHMSTINKLKELFGEDGYLEESNILKTLKRLDTILRKVDDRALESAPIPEGYSEEVIQKEETIVSKRIALAKKISKKFVHDYSRTENNQILRFLGLPMVSGVHLNTMMDMIPIIYDSFEIKKGKEFNWDGTGLDEYKYRNDIEYQQEYDDKYTRTRPKNLLGLEQDYIRGRDCVSFDGLEETREEIHKYINSNDILVSALPCDTHCPTCPEQRIRLCWYHNKEQIQQGV